ncbi:ABC transporter permease subunit [Halomonas sp. 18H]|nr:ABC transporter permease subunit [Halomonas sp. 18H]MCW4151511.1 ABC transporter permease subunit [Halomonas sp. 18H]
MELIHYALDNLDLLGPRMLEHIALVGVAVGIATVTGVPIGIAITQNERLAKSVLYAASIIVTIPSIALFGIMIPVLSLIGQGIGYLPAVIAVLLYSQLPIIRNTYTAINNVDPALREAARGIGMSQNQRSASGIVSDDFSNEQNWALNVRFYAMTYGTPVIMANRYGPEGASHFWGGSRILGPGGELLATADDRETLVAAHLSRTAIAKARFELPTHRDADTPLVRDLMAGYR